MKRVYSHTLPKPEHSQHASLVYNIQEGVSIELSTDPAHSSFYTSSYANNKNDLVASRPKARPGNQYHCHQHSRIRNANNIMMTQTVPASPATQAASSLLGYLRSSIQTATETASPSSSTHEVAASSASSTTPMTPGKLAAARFVNSYQATTPANIRSCTMKDAQYVIQDAEEFRTLQLLLRQNDCITDLTLKMNLHKLLRERRMAMELHKKQQQSPAGGYKFKGYHSKTIATPPATEKTIDKTSSNSPQSIMDVMNVQDANGNKLLPVPDLDMISEEQEQW